MAEEEKKHQGNFAPMEEEKHEDDAIDGTDLTEDEERTELRRRSALSSDIFDFLEMLIIASCAVLFLFTCIARISIVDGTSMTDTLEDGDKLLVSDLFYTPSQGDIVVFQDLNVSSKAIVKRVIATEGQTVRLAYNADLTMTVYVNGTPLDEPYRYYDSMLSARLYAGSPLYQSFLTETVVPDNCVFVLGDNTYNSNDSRGDFGFVSEDAIFGRVVFRLMGSGFSDLFEKIGFVA